MDNLIVVAKTEDEISQLEIFVYEESEENLYAHHDLMLPSFPLCLEWLDFPPISSPARRDPSASASGSATDPAQFGNFIAVGTLEPEIEIWSLDTVETMYPDMVLGRPDKTAAHVPVPLGTGKKKRKKTKARAASAAHHVDVLRRDVAAAVRRSLEGGALHGDGEEVEVVKQRGEPALADDRAGELFGDLLEGLDICVDKLIFIW